MKPILDDDIVISGISGRYPKSASLQVSLFEKLFKSQSGRLFSLNEPVSSLGILGQSDQRKRNVHGGNQKMDVEYAVVLLC